MTVEEFVQSTVEGPGALSPEALVFYDKQVVEAETALRNARQRSEAVSQRVASLTRRQAAINKRLTDVKTQVHDKAGLRAVIADLKAVKKECERRSSLEAEQRVLTDALQMLVGGDIADAELAVREARAEVRKAERAWFDAKGRSDTAKLWADLAPAMRRDPSLTVQMEQGGVVVEYVKALNQLEGEIQAMEESLATQTRLVRDQQVKLGVVTATTEHSEDAA
jgi:DNA repair exonuclease SbcCD ATPase subunit